MSEELNAYMLKGAGKIVFSGLCDACGSIFFSIKTNKRFCSHPCYIKNTSGKNHPRWSGGRSIRKQDGYIMLNARDYKSSRYRKGRGYGEVFEHVLVMSNHIGRPLEKHESVHHKNGIKDDNRIENLELWAKHQPTGQRVEDLVEFVFTHYNEEIRAKIKVQDLVRQVIERVTSHGL